MMGGRETPKKLGYKCAPVHFVHHEFRTKSSKTPQLKARIICILPLMFLGQLSEGV
jgi:hypothetical protein